MSKKISPFDDGSGKPNLEFLSYLQGIFSESFLSKLVNSTMFVEEVDITADATAGVKFYLPLNAKIIDMWAIAQATSSNGTVTLKNNAESPVTLATALALAADGAVARMAAGVVVANAAALTDTGDGFQLVTYGAGDRGRVFIAYTC